MKTVQQKVDDSCKAFETLGDKLIKFSKDYHGRTAFDCIDAYRQQTGEPYLKLEHLFFTACDKGFIRLYLGTDHRIVIGK